MSRRPEPLDPATDALLAAERAFPPQAEERRRRALARADTAVAQGKAPRRWPVHGRLGGRWPAAIGVVIAAAAAWAAFRDLRREPSIRPSPDVIHPSPDVIHPSPDLIHPPPDLIHPSPKIAPSAPETPAHEAPDVPQQEPRSAVPGAARSAPAEARRTTPPRSSRQSAPSDGYDAELRWLEPARSAMARGNFSSALAALSEHQRRFPAGKLAEEREALRIKAMLGLGFGDDARAAAADFRKRFPTSVLLPRVEEMVQVVP